MSFPKFWPTWPDRSWLAQITSTLFQPQEALITRHHPSVPREAPFAPCRIYTAYCSNYPNRYPPLSSFSTDCWNQMTLSVSFNFTSQVAATKKAAPRSENDSHSCRPVFERTAAALEVKCLTPTRRWHPMHRWLDPRCACGLINQAAVVSSRSRSLFALTPAPVVSFLK